MKITTLFVAFVAFFTQLVNAQKPEQSFDFDGSYYHIIPIDSTAGEPKPLFWFWYDQGTEGFYTEARLNFDAPATAGLIFGKTFGGEKFFITPKVGVLIAGNEEGFDGLSAEFNCGGKIDINSNIYWNYFVMNQYAFSTGEDENFIYNYSQTGFGLGLFEINISAQFFQQADASFMDIGPQVKFTLWETGLYSKVWATTDPGNEKQETAFVAIGWHFSKK
ncbi:MAG: hypothetical protein KBF62_02000 [Candidatus Pacebacteria bacterium]|nr:hypothetical protein [Candidatus Paceibacterota bacterium]MBP9058392.1 hypothetical protein [Candidatus Paceibacterota bacterium]MBP9769867.1 hypothetical protein [Candidatus Paceibacterota bacterium]